MKIIHTLALVSLLTVFAVPAEAKDDKAKQAAEKKKAEREKERAERKQLRDQIDSFLDARDKNKDGSLTHDEFMSAETDKEAGQSKFDKFNKNGDRSLTRKEIQNMLGL